MNTISSSNGQEILNYPLLNNRYRLLSNIGYGLTSKVYKVLDIFTNEIKAAKIFGKKGLSVFKKEDKILKLVNSFNNDTNIKLYDSGIGILKMNNQKRQKAYIILEYGNKGTLYDKIEKTTDGFSEDVCKYLFSKILKEVKALHEKGICHRDIKLENILLFGDNLELKLCDFGFSTSFFKENSQKRKLKKAVGTVYYTAPEILERKPYNGEKVDYFSLGALLFILMTKKFAFEEAKTFNYIERESQRLYHLIKLKQFDEFWKIIEKNYNIKILSPQFKELFIKMVAYNPSERPTFEDIMNSEWMKEISNANEEYLKQLRDKMKSEMN